MQVTIINRIWDILAMLSPYFTIPALTTCNGQCRCSSGLFLASSASVT